MERKKVGKSFNLEWTGEDIQTNISIKAKLKENGIQFPDIFVGCFLSDFFLIGVITILLPETL